MLFKPQFHHASTFLLSWGRCTFDSYFLSLPQHPICTTHQLGTQSKQKQQQELAAIHYNRIKTFLGTSASPSYQPWRTATILLFPPITDTIPESGPISTWRTTFWRSQLLNQKPQLRTAGGNRTGQQKGDKITWLTTQAAVCPLFQSS